MIALGCDHGGYELKQEIIKYLEENHIEYQDFGCDSTDSTDYPIYAKRVAIAIQTAKRESWYVEPVLVFLLLPINSKESVQHSVQTASVQRQHVFTTMPTFLRWAEEL